MARRFDRRRSLAPRLARDAFLARLAADNAKVAAEALRLTQSDEPFSERVFGEPMPAQLCVALHQDADRWADMKNRLNEPRVLSRRAQTIQELLALGREMLHTPLVRRYETLIKRFKPRRVSQGQATQPPKPVAERLGVA